MRDVTYTTLSGNSLANMAEDSHAVAWHANHAQHYLANSKKASGPGNESRRESFLNAASAHIESAKSHANSYEAATSSMPSTGGFTATPQQNSTSEMYRNN